MRKLAAFKDTHYSAVGLQNGIINAFGYQMTISVIALSLLLSPAWIALFKSGLRFSTPSSVAGETTSR